MSLFSFWYRFFLMFWFGDCCFMQRRVWGSFSKYNKFKLVIIVLDILIVINLFNVIELDCWMLFFVIYSIKINK